MILTAHTECTSTMAMFIYGKCAPASRQSNLYASNYFAACEYPTQFGSHGENDRRSLFINNLFFIHLFGAFEKTFAENLKVDPTWTPKWSTQ